MPTPSSRAALLLLALVTAPTACDDGSGLDRIAVAAEGAVVGQGEAPVEGIWVHLLAGSEAAPRPLAADETDISGAFEISLEVDPTDCGALRLEVRDTQAFDAGATPLDAVVLGGCGNHVVDFVVDVAPPLPGAAPSGGG